MLFRSTVLVAGRPVPFLGAKSGAGAADYYAYGGDYGDIPNDGTFVLNGLLESDRSPKPHYREVARVNRPIRVQSVDWAQGKIRIENRHQFIDLSGYVGTWEWTDQGVTVASGALSPLICGPGATFDLAVPPPPAGRERLLTLCWALARAQSWADAGFVAAWEQLRLDPAPSLSAPQLQPGRVAIEETPESILLRGSSHAVRIGRQSGMIESLSYGGHELLASPLRLCFWRPPVANDRGWKMPEALGAWRSAGAEAHATRVAAMRQADGTVSVQAELNLPVAGSHATLQYQIDTSGRIIVRAVVTPGRLGASAPKDEVPRIALQAGLVGALHQVEWLGLGPDESYPDRWASARFGLFQADALKWNHSYLPPQETGHRSDVRRATITAREDRRAHV